MARHILDKVFEPLHKGDYEKAYSALQDIFKREPEIANIRDIQVMWAHLEMVVNKNVSKAMQLLEKAQESGCSELPYFYHVRGDVMLEKGKLEAAIKDYERSIAADPNVNNLSMLGQALSATDDPRAVSVWQDVLKKDPENCLAHIFLAKEAEQRGDSAQALEMIQKAERLKPSCADEVFEIGRVYQSLEHHQQALE